MNQVLDIMEEKEIAETRVGFGFGSGEGRGGTGPLLLYLEGLSENKDEHIFCNIPEDGIDPMENNNKYFVKSISDQMYGTSCLASYSNGSSSWLVMMKDSDDGDGDGDGDGDVDSSPSSSLSCFLWNPVSLETIQLPPLQIQEECSDDDDEIRLTILSSPPTDPDCMVLVFLESNTTIIYCRPCIDKQWFRQHYTIGDGDGDNITCAVSVSNSVYARTFKAKILVIDTTATASSLSLRLLEVKDPEYPPETLHLQTHYVESCGDLFLVCIIFIGLEENQGINSIMVFKMDFSVMSWVKVKSLGDCRAFFLDLYGSTSCAGGGRIKGNCIYFTLSDDKSLYTYHMEDGNVSVSLPCPVLKAPFSDPYWIMPTSRSDEKGEEDQAKMTVAPPPTQWSADLIAETTTSATARSPWLMYSTQEEEDACFFLDPGSNKTYFMNLPELSGAKIRFCKDNWLLMTRGKRCIFFFNPFTKAMIELTEMPLNYLFDGITFSSLPTSSDCMVFAVARTLPNYVEICSYHVGQDKSWNHLVVQYTEEKPFIPSYSNPVFYDGAFHCLGSDGRLGVFSAKEDGWILTVLPNAHPCPCSSSDYTYLVDCDGELFSVFVGHVGESLHVFKLDHRTMSWETVKSLGDHMVCLSHTTSLARMTPEKMMQNKIYFPRVWNNNNNNNLVVFYSMETGRYHSSYNHSTADFYGTKEQLHCSWI